MPIMPREDVLFDMPNNCKVCTLLQVVPLTGGISGACMMRCYVPFGPLNRTRIGWARHRRQDTRQMPYAHKCRDSKAAMYKHDTRQGYCRISKKSKLVFTLACYRPSSDPCYD